MRARKLSGYRARRTSVVRSVVGCQRLTRSADTDLRMRVTVLLEQHQASAVASLTPILEHSNRQIYRAELVDGLALVGLDRVATNAKSPRSDCVTHAHHIDSVTGRRARAGQVISGPDASVDLVQTVPLGAQTRS